VDGESASGPTTFNNHFFPETAVAAVEVLEGAGYSVHVPARSLCCGRPLYGYGMLKPAKRLLQGVLRALRREVRSGVPLVGLEPSCLSVFRDELVNLFPNDEDARRLSQQTFTLSEFLMREGVPLPELRRKALVHGHCHHKSVLGFEPEQQLLEKLGLDVDVLDAGCCGMAGSFGFEAGEKYEVSIKCAERRLLPAIRQAPPDAFMVTDGFSCREQIAQLSGRPALHTARRCSGWLRAKQRQAADRIVLPAQVAGRLSDDHLQRRPDMALQQVPADGAPVGQSTHDVDVELRFAVTQGDVAQK
jgi:Fe-S oxidoreductase